MDHHTHSMDLINQSINQSKDRGKPNKHTQSINQLYVSILISQSLTQTFHLVQNGREVVKSHPSQPLDVHIDFRQSPLQIVALSRLLRSCSPCSPFLGGVPHSAKGALHVTPRPVRLAARLSPRRRRDFLGNSGCRLRGKESSAQSTVNGIAGQNL